MKGDKYEMEMEEKNISPVKKPSGWGARHTLAILGFWGFAISYAMRFNLSLAIVAMVNSTKNHDHSSNESSIQISEVACSHLQKSFLQNLSNAEVQLEKSKTEGEFNWDEAEQGLILGSFFWGYVITQLPGGIIAQKYGGKWPLGLGLLITAIFAILTPWAARTSRSLLIIARVVQGLGEGVTTPAMHAILATWAPPDERSKLGSIVYAGSQFGTAVTMVVSGYLIHGGVMGGWPSVFYCIGIFSLGWFVLWTLFMYDSPKDHPRISTEELNYIEKSLGTQSSKVSIPTPWVKIMTSWPVWAIIIGHVGHAWGLYTLLTMLPTYLKTVLHFDIKQNSWLSAMPYFIMWITSILFSQFADTVISNKWLKTVTVRKICQSIGHIVAALALIAASYSGCDRTMTIIMLTLAVSINGAIYGGYVVNHVDIAPNFAGVLMGITNTFANITGFAAPYVAGLLINNDPSVQNWQYIFFIAAAIYVVDVTFFAVFASGTEQSWNRAADTSNSVVSNELHSNEVAHVVKNGHQEKTL